MDASRTRHPHIPLPTWASTRGFRAAAIVSLCFVVAELAQVYLSNTFGWLAGGAAAGLVLFTLSPLQRIAERSVSGRRGRKLPRHDRLTLYRQQLQAAWSDGTMTSRERILLDGLRERLGLSLEEASDVEHEILVG